MQAQRADVALRRRRAARPRRDARESRDSGRLRCRCRARPAPARGRPATARAVLRRRPPDDARRRPDARPSARRASASSVDTPAPGISSARPSPRANARPIRVLVKLPGPVPTTSASRSAGVDPALAKRSSTSPTSARAVPQRSPSTRPSSEEGARRDVSRGVEGEDEHYELRCLLAAPSRPTRARSGGGRRPRARATPRRAPAGSADDARLGPLDEDHRVVEVRLEIAPLGSRHLREAIEVEVRDVDRPA